MSKPVAEGVYGLHVVDLRRQIEQKTDAVSPTFRCVRIVGRGAAWLASWPMASVAGVCAAAGGALGLLVSWSGGGDGLLDRLADSAGVGTALGGVAGSAVWGVCRVATRKPTTFGSNTGSRLQVGVPPRLADAHQRRPELLQLIADGLETAGSALLSQVVASGNGGVGKTQLAAMFNLSRSRTTDLRVWVTATSRESVMAAYADAATAIDVAPADARPQEASRRFVEWLAATDTSWLVVLDDVTDESVLDGLLPQGPSGELLITTRLRRLPIGPAECINVDVFTPTEALAYFAESLASPDLAHAQVIDEAAELAEDLGHLPLALSHAAAVIAHDGITCADYRRRFADRSIALRDLLPGRPPDDYAHTVATTWELAIERADAMAPAGLARPAMALASVLDPNGAPDTLWTVPPTLRWATTPQPDTHAMRQALRNLHQLNLLVHDPNGGPLTVRTHVMVQRAITDTLTRDELDRVVRVAADAISAVWPTPENQPGLSKVLRTNTSSLMGQPTNALLRPGVHPVLFKERRSLSEAGLLAQALASSTDLARSASDQLGPDHPDTLSARHRIAYCLEDAGDAAGAAAALEEILTDRLRILGPDHPDTLATRGHLAFCRGLVGDADGAAAAFEELLADRLRIFGPAQSDAQGTLNTRHNLAFWQGEAGDPAGAAAALRGVLADHLRVVGPDDPHTLFVAFNLARYQGRAGDPAGAAAALGDLVADSLRVFGPDHPHTLNTRCELARWQGEAGDPGGAGIALEELLADCLRVLGSDHPHTSATRDGLTRWRTKGQWRGLRRRG